MPPQRAIRAGAGYPLDVTTSEGRHPPTIEEVDAIRRRVLNVVGHELRTPVTALAGLVEQLATAEIDEIRDRLAPAIARLTQRTELLLDDLLLGSGISTALPTDEPAAHHLATVAKDVWAGFGSATDHVQFRIVGDDPPVRMSEIGLRRMMRHLLHNALLYAGGEVEVRTTAEDGSVRLEVRNDGPPPRDDELALAFEPFYRGEHAVMTGPGLGLGLPIARLLAEQAGGSVELERREHGMVAVVMLPAA